MPSGKSKQKNKNNKPNTGCTLKACWLVHNTEVSWLDKEKEHSHPNKGVVTDLRRNEGANEPTFVKGPKTN